MTDEQVIKALECCTKKYGCCDCPLENDELCMITINKEALSLIKRQQAEIYNLKEDLSEYRNMPILTKNDCMIATVEKRADGKQYHNALLTIKVDEIRAEAYKEFAEKLKKDKYVSSDWSHGEHPYVVEEDDIDNLLWVLTEGSNGE